MSNTFGPTSDRCPTLAARLALQACVASATLWAPACAVESSPSAVDDAGTDAPVVNECYRCHGDPAQGNNAPPPSSWAPDAGQDVHQRHLAASSWRHSVACAACHVIPDKPEDPGHNDDPLPAEITFGEGAVAAGATPAYDGDARSCQGAYCHGGTLRPGAASTTPDWDEPVDVDATCGVSCHETPPAPPHPLSSKCVDCHSSVVDAAGDIAAAALHIDGELQVDEVPCTFCHGDATLADEATEAAPPVDTEGNDASSSPGVGAHREHLTASDWHAALTCDACHLVPPAVVSDGHIDAERPADLTWGPLATAMSATPAYDGASCSGVYCHGATLPEGASNNTPVWTTVDGTQDQCGSCHGLPPTASWHPFVRDPSSCGPCHPYTGHAPDVPATHLDGAIDWVEPLGCNFCHGSEESSAPPTDLAGESDPSRTGVGAHANHVLETASTNAIGCTECHIEPTYWIAMGHRDGMPPSELWFGPIAQTGGRAPAWNGATCADCYCHNPNPLDLNPSKLTEPVWTLVDGSQGRCDSCHGYPPWTLTHPLDPACGDCHALVVGLDHVTITNKSLHLNGLPEEN